MKTCHNRNPAKSEFQTSRQFDRAQRVAVMRCGCIEVGRDSLQEIERFEILGHFESRFFFCFILLFIFNVFKLYTSVAMSRDMRRRSRSRSPRRGGGGDFRGSYGQSLLRFSFPLLSFSFPALFLSTLYLYRRLHRLFTVLHLEGSARLIQKSSIWPLLLTTSTFSLIKQPFTYYFPEAKIIIIVFGYILSPTVWFPIRSINSNLLTGSRLQRQTQFF